MLITRLLNKLLQDVQQTKKSYYVQVENACISALQDIRTEDVEVDQGKNEKILRQKSAEYEDQSAGGNGGEDAAGANLDLLVGEETRPQISVDSEKFYLPFEIACKGDSSRITVTALDGIQKVLAYGEITGDYPDPTSPSRRLIDRIVETICSCHHHYNGKSSETDEGVELQIIKALLTIVTSEQVQVHEGTFLLILRTCCVIHLTTKSAVNRRTARAMLTQMLHNIFNRMEIAAEELDSRVEANEQNNVEQDNEFRAFQGWEAECSNLVQEVFSNSILSVSSVLDIPIPIVTKRDTGVESDYSFSFKDINENSANFPEEGNSQEPNVNGHFQSEDENLRDELVKQTEAISEESSNKSSSVPSSKIPNQNNNYSHSNSYSLESHQMSTLQKDAFLSFWTLTKLALKPLSKSSDSAENENEINSKNHKNALEQKFQQSILSFHLLKEILDKSGRIFKTSSIFVTAMKHHLFQALLENKVSRNLEVYKLQTEILMILIKKFIQILPDEIEILLNTFIFPVLDDPFSTTYPVEHLKVVLESISNISNNLDCFIQLYLSYEKQQEGEQQNEATTPKPFQKLVTCLSKICSSSPDKPEIVQIAVEIVTNILKSMSNACPRLDRTNKSSSDANRVGQEQDKIRRFSSFEEPLKFGDDFVEKMELEGKDFLSCLHLFLAKVDVPCDVLKIDWSVQKLAQKMMNTSSVNSFHTETADSWYALVYASMSLIADIRITNCQGKSKMSRNQFLKLNRSINECPALETSFLTTIYNEIEDHYRRSSNLTPNSNEEPGKWLAETGKDECEILEVIKYMLDCTSLLRSHFSLEKKLKHVKKMITICGPSFLNALISVLQNTNDTCLSDICLEGVHSGIRIVCVLGLDNERESFVQGLAKLSMGALEEIRGKHINSKVVTRKTSTLTMTEHGVTKTVVTTTTEMKCRSVDVILTLLDVGIAEGNHLGGSWLHILKFMSQLLSTPLFAFTDSKNSSRSGSPIPPLPSDSSTLTSTSGSSWASWAGSIRDTFEKKLWDPSVKELHPSVKESIARSVEKVFTGSEMLTGDAMTDFFQGLCQVSLHDMMNFESSTHLMYNRISEVALSNFYRPALQWSQIWQVITDYFCHLACSSKEEISSLALDSLNKLVLNLLKKETLEGYRFQNHFFAPYKIIMINTRSRSTREAILGFLETVITLHSDLLLSGWVAILSILAANIVNNEAEAAIESFGVLQCIVDKCEKGEINLRYSYGSIVKSLASIAADSTVILDISDKAFSLIKDLAKIPYKHSDMLMEIGDEKHYRVWAFGWKPIFNELSAIVLNPAGKQSDDLTLNNKETKQSQWDVKTKALITLFEIIKMYGDSFEKEWWNSVFEALFTIFDYIKLKHEKEKEDLILPLLSPAKPTHQQQSAIITSSTNSCFRPPLTDPEQRNYEYFYCYYYTQFAIFDLFIQFYDTTGVYVLNELLKHLEWCICQGHEKIALSGLSCLQQLISRLRKNFSVKEWDCILSVLKEMIQSRYSANEAVVTLELLKIMDNILFPTASYLSGADAKAESHRILINPQLTSDQVSTILQLLISSHEVAKEHCIIQSEHELQRKTSTDSLSSRVIDFIPHETLSLQIYLKVLFAIYRAEKSYSTDQVKTEMMGQDKLWELIQQSCISSCNYFIIIKGNDHREAWTDLLCFLFSNIMQLSGSHFQTITCQLYPYLCDMMEVDLLHPRICVKLQEYLLLVGKHYGVL